MVLYINDLPEIVTSSVKLFADDTKLYNQITRGNSEGGDRIQADLQTLEGWSNTWPAIKVQCPQMQMYAHGLRQPIQKLHLRWGDDKAGFAILYRAYIRPHLEYCVQAWSPYLQKDIKCLEKVQRRATKLVPSLREKEYEERMKELDLYPLVVRIVRGDLIETFKILSGFEDIDASMFSVVKTTTRGHSIRVRNKEGPRFKYPQK